MGNHAPPDPKGWAEIREQNRNNGRTLRAYTVVGRHEVFGLQPGETGELELTASQAVALVEGGHLVAAEEAHAAEPAEETAPLAETAADGEPPAGLLPADITTQEGA